MKWSCKNEKCFISTAACGSLPKVMVTAPDDRPVKCCYMGGHDNVGCGGGEGVRRHGFPWLLFKANVLGGQRRDGNQCLGCGRLLLVLGDRNCHPREQLSEGGRGGRGGWVLVSGSDGSTVLPSPSVALIAGGREFSDFFILVFLKKK
jgi:hypothetical protein